MAKVRKQQNIYLFSIALVDFCDNFTSNTAVSSRGGTLSVYVCIKKIGVCVHARGGGGGYLLISVAEIRYRHDLVRLCHKFYFCPFQMKIPHIDEEKEMYALSIDGSV